MVDTLYTVLAVCDTLTLSIALSIAQRTEACVTEFSDILSISSQSHQVHFSVPSPAVTASICGYKASRDRLDDVECLVYGYHLSLYFVSRPLGVHLLSYSLDRVAGSLAASQIPCSSRWPLC